MPRASTKVVASGNGGVLDMISLSVSLSLAPSLSLTAKSGVSGFYEQFYKKYRMATAGR